MKQDPKLIAGTIARLHAPGGYYTWFCDIKKFKSEHLKFEREILLSFEDFAFDNEHAWIFTRG